jgi:hypothetical protein
MDRSEGKVEILVFDNKLTCSVYRRLKYIIPRLRLITLNYRLSRTPDNNTTAVPHNRRSASIYAL